MSTKGFFDEGREHSLVKTGIVSKYFWAWARIIMKTAGKIAYVDLFAGTGRFRDGTKSTPLLILEKAITDLEMRQKLVAVFNDREQSHSRTLEAEISRLPGIDTLMYKPQVLTFDAGDRIFRALDQMFPVPTLLFLDPWGYKGLSLGLVNSVVRNWGCECIFFFNYNRINPALSNKSVQERVDEIFGRPRADALRIRVSGLQPLEREGLIMGELIQALKDTHGKYVLSFRFKKDSGTRTSHYLVFVTKRFEGYRIMKDIMAIESSFSLQGVPSFEYNPARVRQPWLLPVDQPLDELEALLLSEYAGVTLSVKEIYQRHSVGRPYIMRNYKDVLARLEKSGMVDADPPVRQRRKGTFRDDVKITFPPKGGNHGD